jgi:hypothetical protein
VARAAVAADELAAHAKTWERAREARLADGEAAWSALVQAMSSSPPAGVLSPDASAPSGCCAPPHPAHAHAHASACPPGPGRADRVRAARSGTPNFAGKARTALRSLGSAGTGGTGGAASAGPASPSLWGRGGAPPGGALSPSPGFALAAYKTPSPS